VIVGALGTNCLDALRKSELSGRGGGYRHNRENSPTDGPAHASPLVALTSRSQSQSPYPLERITLNSAILASGSMFPVGASILHVNIFRAAVG
jgi:hypothetical protein